MENCNKKVVKVVTCQIDLDTVLERQKSLQQLYSYIQILTREPNVKLILLFCRSVNVSDKTFFLGEIVDWICIIIIDIQWNKCNITINFLKAYLVLIAKMWKCYLKDKIKPRNELNVSQVINSFSCKVASYQNSDLSQLMTRIHISLVLVTLALWL